jgi:hypothetical protein
MLESKPAAVELERTRLVAVAITSVWLAGVVGGPVAWSVAAAMVVVSAVSWPWLSRGVMTPAG